MANYFGIDFGTTNSAVVAIADINGERVGEARKIGEDERNPLPSFVAINKKTGEVKTGLDAKNTIADSADYRVFSSIKSVIDEDKEWEIAGRKWTPIDIATELFKALKVNVKDKTAGGMELDQAVVAVPVGFSPKKKNSVRRAAKEAGIKIKMFISEPTSAYCSRLNEMKKYKNVAVFDWGGGTLDVVVLRIENNIINELATVGMPLAGNDIDRIIAEKVCTRVARKTNQNFTYDDLAPEFKLRLLNLCEQAKCNLSDEDIATISIAKLDKFGRALEKIDYDYFYEIIENEVDQAIDCLLKALSEAGMNRESIDCIICEGGSSRLRPLQSKLLEYFDREKLLFPRTAMWDIGSGAAEISYRPGCYTLNKPIGIIQSNNKFYPLLKVGQRVPTEEKCIKFGVVEATKEARFVFSDGEDDGDKSFVEYFPVKLRGFSDEYLQISCYIDADMVFRIKIHSNRMPDDVFRVWTYSNLKVSYELDAPAPKKNAEID
ncbi:MAG: Hsp70 family protein [Lachnospiraceae bacterium]|nr:Hsp70 family protein [Lachnospiraceae bacterium]